MPVATPVAALELPRRDAQPTLARRILQRRAETPSIQASNASGWHSDREIATLGR